MKFIQVGDLLIHLDAIASVKLQLPNTWPDANRNRVELKLQNGDEHMFEDEAADKVRAFFAESKEVEVYDVMNPPSSGLPFGSLKRS